MYFFINFFKLNKIIFQLFFAWLTNAHSIRFREIGEIKVILLTERQKRVIINYKIKRGRQNE